MASEAALLDAIDAAFSNTAKLLRFHPDDGDPEGADHEALLQSRTLESISRHDVRAGWDPLTNACPQGLAYYFPALARFALLPDADILDWYALQLVFCLSQGGREIRFLNYCSPEQRSAVAELLRFIRSERQSQVRESYLEDEICECLYIWRGCDDKL